METKYKNILNIIRNIANILGILAAILYVIYITYFPICSILSASLYCNTGSGFGWSVMNYFPVFIICSGVFWILIGKGSKKTILWSIFRTIIYIALILILIPQLVNNDLIPYGRYGITSNPPLESARSWAIFSYTILLLLISGLDLLISIFVLFYKNSKNTKIIK
ncbi:MAG: hypothetical protein PHR47_00600 [Candidatus Pacebacteria bacterium]|nr:hypothetical protein [Candidatus Paceibacterota bacterium]